MRRLRGAWIREVGGGLAGSAHGADGVSLGGRGRGAGFRSGERGGFMRRLRGAWMREVGGGLAGSAHGADGVSWAGRMRGFRMARAEFWKARGGRVG